MAATARAVDLTDVKEGGNFKPRRKPEGDYRAKIVKADDHQPNDKSKPLGWVLTVQVDGDSRSTYPVYLSPDAKQAWKIAQVCRAAGLNVKNARVRFDPNKLVNKAIGVYLEDDEFEGRPKSVIGEMFPASEVGANADEDVIDDEEIVDEDEVDLGDDEPEEEEPPPPVKRRRKAAPEPEPEEEEEEEPEPEPAPVRRRRKPEPEPEPEEDVEEEEEIEEEPPVPAKRRIVKKAAAPAPRRRKPAPVVEEDEDEDLDLDDLDD